VTTDVILICNDRGVKEFSKGALSSRRNDPAGTDTSFAHEALKVLTPEETVEAIHHDISNTFPGLGLFQVTLYSIIHQLILNVSFQ
jgi:hypothetical protein